MKKEVSSPDKDDGAAIDDIEEIGLEIHVDAEKTVQLRLIEEALEDGSLGH